MHLSTTKQILHTHQIRKGIADVLGTVADPEIPVVSIVDLGMVVDIRCDNDQWKVDLATTYSGCPAIDVIPMLARIKLSEAGFNDVEVRMTISPPWSTDWISETGKDKLMAYGIAPPNGQASGIHAEGIPKQCPQCGSENLEEISRYGSTPCKSAYRCLTCLEPFDYFKCY